MQVEWLILADSAQVVGNKLYLLGGGWETLAVGGGFPTQQYCAIAVSYRVGWNETNQRHNVQVEIAHEDGQILLQVDGQVEVGRPPGLPAGADQRTQLSFAALLPFDRPGTYVVIARIENQEEERRFPFRVIPAAPAFRVGPGAPG